LIIDPTVTYATYVSGSGFDNVNWSARDQAGNQYLTGLACSSDFPVGTISSNPEYQSAYGGGCDAFVTVLNPSGIELIYSTYLGGYAYSSDFPTFGSSILESNFSGFLSGWVTKLNPSGGFVFCLSPFVIASLGLNPDSYTYS